MLLVLTYILAAAGAWCLFSPGSITWLLPALLVSLLAHVTRRVPAASWILVTFAGSLALWSGWTFRCAMDPDRGIGTLVLGLTPILQLSTIVLVLAPLLTSVCWLCGRERPRLLPGRGGFARGR